VALKHRLSGDWQEVTATCSAMFNAAELARALIEHPDWQNAVAKYEGLGFARITEPAHGAAKAAATH